MANHVAPNFEKKLCCTGTLRRFIYYGDLKKEQIQKVVSIPSKGLLQSKVGNKMTSVPKKCFIHSFYLSKTQF